MNPIDALCQYHPFDTLTVEEREELTAQVEVMPIARETVILQQGGEPSHYVYVVQSGAAALLTNGETSQLLETGESFGYPSLLSGNPPVYDVIVTEEGSHYRLPAALFHILLDNVTFAEYYLKSLIERLQRATRLQVPPPNAV